jgi:hypothetical protein
MVKNFLGTRTRGHESVFERRLGDKEFKFKRVF